MISQAYWSGLIFHHREVENDSDPLACHICLINRQLFQCCRHCEDRSILIQFAEAAPLIIFQVFFRIAISSLNSGDALNDET
jgi:hypothetical protein